MNNRTQSLVLTEDLEPWLRDHGFEMRQVQSASIDLSADGRGARAWLEVEFIKLNEEGRIYADRRNNVATGRTTVPLKSWPPLTLVEIPATAEYLP